MNSITVDEIRHVASLLARAYPYVERRKAAEGVFDDSPLESLVRAILSQNTTDVNRDRAFSTLRRQFPSWEAVADAPGEAVEAAIRQTNYAFTKAGRIQHILRQLRDEYSAITLDFLRDWPTERITTYLTGFPGIGRKSAAIVCLFTLQRPLMPVDTHVLRVTQRLGWVAEKITPDNAQTRLHHLVPPELILPLHLALWEHGHSTCRPTPKCARCAIYAHCRYPAKTAPCPSIEEAIALTAGGDEGST